MNEKSKLIIKLAGIVIEIHLLYQYTRTLCENYVIINDEQISPDIIVDIVPRNILRENDETQINRSRADNDLKLFFDPGYLESFAVQRKICEAMPLFGAFLMHGTVVAMNGRGYMFTAPSGTGKTTRAKIWLEEYPDSFIVNGDKPLLGITDNDVIAYGTPWCGKEHWNANIGVPLQAIYILERTAPGEDNSIKEIEMTDAFDILVKHAYMPEDTRAMINTISLLKSLEGKVKIYLFRSAPTKEAVHLAFNTACPQN